MPQNQNPLDLTKFPGLGPFAFASPQALSNEAEFDASKDIYRGAPVISECDKAENSDFRKQIQTLLDSYTIWIKEHLPQSVGDNRLEDAVTKFRDALFNPDFSGEQSDQFFIELKLALEKIRLFLNTESISLEFRKAKCHELWERFLVQNQQGEQQVAMAVCAPGWLLHSADILKDFRTNASFSLFHILQNLRTQIIENAALVHAENHNVADDSYAHVVIIFINYALAQSWNPGLQSVKEIDERNAGFANIDETTFPDLEEKFQDEYVYDAQVTAIKTAFFERITNPFLIEVPNRREHGYEYNLQFLQHVENAAKALGFTEVEYNSFILQKEIGGQYFIQIDDASLTQLIFQKLIEENVIDLAQLLEKKLGKNINDSLLINKPSFKKDLETLEPHFRLPFIKSFPPAAIKDFFDNDHRNFLTTCSLLPKANIGAFTEYAGYKDILQNCQNDSETFKDFFNRVVPQLPKSGLAQKLLEKAREQTDPKDYHQLIPFMELLENLETQRFLKYLEDNAFSKIAAFKDKLTQDQGSFFRQPGKTYGDRLERLENSLIEKIFKVFCSHPKQNQNILAQARDAVGELLNQEMEPLSTYQNPYWGLLCCLVGIVLAAPVGGTLCYFKTYCDSFFHTELEIGMREIAENTKSYIPTVA